MKKLFSIVAFLFFCSTHAQENKKATSKVVEVSCGQCKFAMTDKKGCDLAVRIDGKSYFVEGTTIDEHGDAHANDGFCSAIRKAEVVGEIKDNKFVVTYFKLLPIDKK
jgi:hypothetical protein